MQIFKKMCDDNGYILDESVEKEIFRIIKRIVGFKTDTFGNAREIRNLYEDILRQQRNRLSKTGLNHTKEELLNIQICDLPSEMKNPEFDVDSIIKELDEMTGLDQVKEEICELANFIQIQNERRDLGIDSSMPSLHMVFSGNPGTGKTTVARLLGKIYKALGVISKGSLIEASRADFVAGYQGQTAIKTKDIINKSLGGVLFIDEAYSLKQGRDDVYGQEAIDTLLKEMEDHRNNLAVIVAGYSGEMRDFLSTNEGLASRFNRYIEFGDYTIDQLVEIFVNRCNKEQYIPTKSLVEKLKKYLGTINISEFGNGRGIRNIFEKILQQQAKRLVQEKKQGKILSKDEYLSINDTDLNNVLNNLDYTK